MTIPHDSGAVWGEEWLHAGIAGLLHASQGEESADPDELVFFVPGRATKVLKLFTVASDLKSRLSPSAAIALSMRWRINAAYLVPDLQYMHEHLSLAAWYGVVAAGRRAWMPVSFAEAICEPAYAQLGIAADTVFRPDIRRWWLDRRIASCAATVTVTGAPRIVKGRVLAMRIAADNPRKREDA